VIVTLSWAESVKAGATPSVRAEAFSSRLDPATEARQLPDQTTWWRSVQVSGNVKPEPATVWTCSNAESDDIVGNPHKMAAQLRTALSCGELKVVGSGTVDGVHAVKLSGSATPPTEDRKRHVSGSQRETRIEPRSRRPHLRAAGNEPAFMPAYRAARSRAGTQSAPV
jgi:hypothetical protein